MALDTATGGYSDVGAVLLGPYDDYIYDENGDMIKVNGYPNPPQIGDPFATSTTYGHDTWGNITFGGSTATYSGYETLSHNFDNFPNTITSTGGSTSLLYDGSDQMTDRDGVQRLIDGIGPYNPTLAEDQAWMNGLAQALNANGHFPGLLVGDGSGNNVGDGTVYDSFGNVISGPGGGYQAGNGANSDTSGVVYQGPNVSDPQTGRDVTKAPRR